MSWLQDLAGKAENILTKIDQNAATVLQTQTRSTAENGDVEGLLEVTSISETGTDYSNPTAPIKPQVVKALSLNIKSLSPRGLNRTSIDLESGSEKQNSSRRSSISSRKDGTVIELSNVYTVDSKTGPDLSVEKELAATKIILAEIKAERDELKIELDSAQSQLSNADDEVKLEEVEMHCRALLEEKNELYFKLVSVEESNGKYIKSISELESIISKHTQNEQDLQQKLEMARMETNNAATELQQYRVRAHATLQVKEKIIEQLKAKSTPTNRQEPNGSGSSEQILVMELEQIKNERQNLNEELAALNDKYEQGKAFWQTMEKKIKGMVTELEDRIGELQQKLNEEKTKSLQLGDNLNIKEKELLSAREDLTKQRTAFSVENHEKDAEITKLRNRIHNRPTTPSSDLEQRLNSLTQSLVQKQTTLESVTAERNALRLQLEKLDSQYRSTVTQIRQQRVPLMSSNETDDAKSQVPNFMVENPFDNNVARRVKRAYSSLDSIGIRLGVFLRRYPLIRILVIVYVAVLHLWVMFVLLSSTPAQ